MSEATLTIGANQTQVVRTVADLAAALAGIDHGAPNDTVTLSFGRKKFIEAERHGEFWSVVTQNGGYLTRASFTAEGTTEYSERTVREARDMRSLWNRAKAALKRVPEQSLSTAQVRTLFSEFFCGRKFTIPQTGA